ncbi:MAG: hypothetical protein JO115_03970 [Pseudonocardiales bacterium]|nr:hypothetical protein [Pseudonocardiales bacterium]
MTSRTKTALLTGAAVLAIAGVGTGIAVAQSADPPSPTPPVPSSAAPTPDDMSDSDGGHGGHGKHGGPLARIVHGEATVTTDHGYQVLDLQRGVVDSANPGQLTVRSADGFTATYAVGDSTKVRKDRKDSDISQVVANDRVTVVATKAGNTITATRIRDTGPAK